ncbi:MAG: SDR family NAD(P)-dependent oxidoreductase, partial [Alphaproteobacteria bacterium]|nr:SDR family NAD(P)-dependent oxidoreductase [Alphaproteobacteria bacterium]
MKLNRAAIVTGSTSGIGLGIAEALCASGVNVMLNGLSSPQDIDAKRRELAERYDVEVAFHGADMSKPEDIRDLTATAKAIFGKVDIVVNNAGIQHVQPIEDFPDAKWDAIIAINLSSAFHTI